MSYDFYMPARVVGGEGVVIAQSALLSRFGKKCVVVTGGTGAVKSGALADLQTALDKESIEYETTYLRCVVSYCCTATVGGINDRFGSFKSMAACYYQTDGVQA